MTKHAEKGSTKEMLSLPIAQLGRCYRLKYYEIIEAPETNQAFIDLNISPEYFDSKLTDYQKKELQYDGNELLFWKLYFKMLVKYPFSYMKGFLYLNQGGWSLDDITIGNIYFPNLYSRMGYLATNTIPGYGVEHTSLFPALEKQLEKIFSINGYQNIPLLYLLFLPGFYMLIILFTIVDAIITRTKETIIVCAFQIIYYLTLLLGPCAIMRYYYPIVITSVFLLGYQNSNHCRGDNNINLKKEG